MKSLLIKATIVSLMQPAIAAAEGRTLIFGNVSGWTVHTNPASGFECFAEAQYDGESSLRVGFRAEGPSLYLRIVEGAWAGAQAVEPVLEIQFDDREPVKYETAGIGRDGSLSVSIANARRNSFLYDLSHSYTLSARLDGGEPVLLSLGGSLNAIRMLQDCQASMRNFSGD